jgi:adenine-specific DNA-methyltransferase
MLSVAEKLNRRWIGCDLGRWGIHATRKRLLGINGCKPFAVLSLGRHERRYWQTANLGGINEDYVAFILQLYDAQPVAGFAYSQGTKSTALVYVGAVDAPITTAEIDAAVDECAKLKRRELHVLGWDWESGRCDVMAEAAAKKGVELLLLQIPREAMEQQAAAGRDIRFFPLAYLDADVEQAGNLSARVALKSFVISDTAFIPHDVRSRAKQWSDYIDYWAVDWDFRNDTFVQGWAAFRTRKERGLPLVSSAHPYENAGKRRILVRVIDIFGNDTRQAFDVDVNYALRTPEFDAQLTSPQPG